MIRAVSAWVAIALTGCGATGGEGSGSPDRGAAGDDGRPASCPARVEAPSPLPGIEPRHRTADYWIERVTAQGPVDEVLLSPERIADHNRAMALPVDDRPLGHTDLLAPPDPDFVKTQVNERLAFIRERLASGAYVKADGSRAAPAELRGYDPVSSLPAPAEQHRIALQAIPLRCGPDVAPLYTPPVDPIFDRNNCSTASPQEVIQLLHRWPNGTWLVQTRHSLGWIPGDAPLSPPVPPAALQGLVHGPQAIARRDVALTDGNATASVPEGTLLPLVPGSTDRVFFADSRGLHESSATRSLLPTARALTRRALIEEAFRRLDEPYGWGGTNGGLDCSGFLLDVLGSFGIEVPRFSGRQALAGTYTIDVESVTNEREKALVIDAAARRGIVLLHFPGHIMLYLGRTEDGRPMAIHAFAEYLTPCDGTATDPEGQPFETLNRVDRTTVSDLELGRGTSRRSFIERITKLVVLGRAPGVELQGVAALRQPAPVRPPEVCDDSIDVAVFESPLRPNARQPLRVIVTSSEDPGPVELALFDPAGARHTPEVHRLGGPPWSFWVEVPAPAAGSWTAVLGDGSRVEACERFSVVERSGPPGDRRRDVGWETRWRWERDTENLYAAFVEQLFMEPRDNEDATWDGLQILIDDPSRNLFHNHLSAGEDGGLRLEPDCADLPYNLRTYFAWKNRLPVGFRQCSRGGPGRPPSCGDLQTNLSAVEPGNEGSMGRQLMNLAKLAAHSGTARTAPRDDDTDLYPVPLTRDALRPGVVYADPYGHLMVVARWIPQGAGDRYGIMLAADAQPDGTVGRRRFFRGSFLFTPDTTDVGAGFKAWRPIVPRGGDRMEALSNRQLTGSTTYVPFSEEQYEGSADDFYDRMEGLINPRPLDAELMLVALVDALLQAVVRRVDSVDNGEEYMREHRYAPIDMPEGYAVFETAGAWEDFSTPARDMRILISIDAVLGFPEAVARAPERFALTADQVPATQSALRRRLDTELAARTFNYTRTDGSTQRLTLRDVVDRRELFEMAYNPNDCAETRWGAEPGSAEHEPCNRRAPQYQRDRMGEYRTWFVERRRPPRPN